MIFKVPSKPFHGSMLLGCVASLMGSQQAGCGELQAAFSWAQCEPTDLEWAA